MSSCVFSPAATAIKSCLRKEVHLSEIQGYELFSLFHSLKQTKPEQNTTLKTSNQQKKKPKKNPSINTKYNKKI